MAQHPMPDRFQENLILYALGLLDAEMAATTEADIQAQGWPATQALHDLEHVMGALGYAAPAARPRPELRQRLLERVAPPQQFSC